jgi:hypothetical protein
MYKRKADQRKEAEKPVARERCLGDPGYVRKAAALGI